jgi:DNA-directed RNA polymerase subunit omega
MIYPSADKIEEKIDSKYALVILAARRARQVKEGSKPLHKTDSTNPLTVALEEIAMGEITYRFDENSLAGKEALEDQKLVAGRRDIEVDIDPLATPDDLVARAATALGAGLEDFLGDDDEELEEVLVEKDEAEDEDEDTPLMLDDEEERAEV